MRYLFIVQGEGRGHLTQAMTLEKLLMGRGHEVVGILVGKSPQRKIPDFFTASVKAPVDYFESMNFVPAVDNRKPSMVKTVLYNTFSLHKYFPSIHHLNERIKASGADVVVNFYELMAGLTYMFYDMDVPMVCIGHQYLFLHKDFNLPRERYPDSFALDFYTKMTAMKAVKHLALSFRPMARDKRHCIVAVPPLLRNEVLSAETSNGDYLLGYMLNDGFAKDVESWHKEHPDVELRFFWDRRDVPKVYEEDDNLTFYQLDDKEFLKQMSGCGAYASTAGFESICEAMYMGKPVLMVPSHIEQEINAFDAIRSKAGVATDRFDLSPLLDFTKNFAPDKEFKLWVDSAYELILNELENI